MCNIVNAGVHRKQQEHKREGGHFHPREPGTRGSVEEVMPELNVGMSRGFAGRPERACHSRHWYLKLLLG